mgnify:CR=1 FL=1
MLDHFATKAVHLITVAISLKDEARVKYDSECSSHKKEQPSTARNVPRANKAPLDTCIKNNYPYRYLDELIKEYECPPDMPRNRHYGRK